MMKNPNLGQRTRVLEGEDDLLTSGEPLSRMFDLEAFQVGLAVLFPGDVVIQHSFNRRLKRSAQNKLGVFGPG
jgi:hypothetical protein